MISLVVAPLFESIKEFLSKLNNEYQAIKIDEQIVLEIAEYSKRKEEIDVNLENQEIKFGNKSIKFDVDAFKKKCLIEGLDDIGLSMEKVSHIDNFEKKIGLDKPWLMKND